MQKDEQSNKKNEGAFDRKKPHWFGFKDRKHRINDIMLIKGNYEKSIKRAGVKFCYNIIKNWRLSYDTPKDLILMFSESDMNE